MSHPFERPPGDTGDLPPPFLPADEDKQKRKAREEHHHVFEIGKQDIDPLAGGSIGEGGMIVGPEHPGFWQPERFPRQPASGTFLPSGAVPPGARFDPITPINPGTTGAGTGPVWPSGEPDPDAEPLGGPQTDPLHPGWKPPRGNPPGGAPHPPGSGSGKIGGAPFFF